MSKVVFFIVYDNAITEYGTCICDLIAYGLDTSQRT